MKTIISIITGIIISISLLNGMNPVNITGHVYDKTGSPLPGVNVTIKNTDRGTITDMNGFYKIEAFPKDQILVFKYIGLETQEIKIEGRKIIDAYMVPSKAELQEVIIHTADEEKAASYLPGKTSGIRIQGHKKVASSFYIADAVMPEFNTEGYSTIHENGYKDVLNQPLSTFSIDVDRASYSNVRRFINMGREPVKDAVRVEEMINYFSYDYAEPAGKHPFSVHTELSVCPWNEEHQLLHVGLKGKEMDKSELPGSNLVFLLDVSGSMSAQNKLPLLKNAFRMLVNELRDEDRVAIVVYAGAAGIVLESTPGNKKEKILTALDKLSAGGSTAGGEGLRLAYKIASENFIEEGNNRIILATDGDFNVGVSSNAEMERLVEKERDRGTFITLLGFGMGNYKDDKMEIIANKGNGNYSYIDNIQEARKVMVSEFAGTLFTIAKDIKFQLEFNPQRVKAYRLIGYENRLLNDEDFNDDKKDAGEMGAGHTVTALYEIIPSGSEEKIAHVDSLKYQQNVTTVEPDPDAELLTIKLRYKKPDGNKSILIEEPVKGRVVDPEMASDNFRFSAAVAEFGLLLRDSEYVQDADYDDVILLAEKAKGNDKEGYRSEFIQLVKTMKVLTEK